MQRIKKGDKVVVIAGKDKGRTGEVVAVSPKDDRAVVSGINVVRPLCKAFGRSDRWLKQSMSRV